MKLKLIGLTAALLCTTSLVTSASASTNIGGGCTGNCSSSSSSGSDTYNEGGEGGQGGQGGYGGDGGNGGQGGSGYGGQGGDVENHNYNDSHNSAEGGYATATGGKVENENKNDSHNSAEGGYATGGSATGGSSSVGNVTNSNTNSANNTSSANNNGSYNTTSNNSNNSSTNTANGGKAEQDQHQSQSISHSGNSKIENSGNSRNTNKNENNNDNSNSNNANQQVNIDNRSPRAPVNTAYAAPLSVGEDTCMGSSSVGGQGFAFGLSIGTTWTDSNCQRLKNSRQLAALGYQRAAVALVCVDDSVREAMTAAGTPCPSANDKVAEAPMVAPVVVAAPAAEPAREWTTSMAPVPDPVRHQRKKKAHKALPPK